MRVITVAVVLGGCLASAVAGPGRRSAQPSKILKEIDAIKIAGGRLRQETTRRVGHAYRLKAREAAQKRSRADCSSCTRSRPTTSASPA